MSAKTKPTSTANVEDLRMLRVEEVAARMGWSTRTLERLCASGEGPPITRMSARRRGIRVDHFRQWLDQRQETGAA
jgi:predicted DNA-binding transcriptional regulator AlpA